jgi:hypothetical protein
LIFFKIRPSLTTSEEGLGTQNIHKKQQGFDSSFGWSIYSAHRGTRLLALLIKIQLFY